MKKPIIISCFVRKGGTGKTTSTLNIADNLSKKNKVLLIDADEQMNLSSFVTNENNIYEINDFLNGVPKEVIKDKSLILLSNENKNLFIIKGSSSIKNKNEKFTRMEKSIFNDNFYSQFNFILTDCPPSSIIDKNNLSRLIAFNSDFIMSPLLADQLSVQGAINVLKSISYLNGQGSRVKILGFFFVNVSPNTRLFKKYYNTMINSVQDTFKSFVRKDIKVIESIENYTLISSYINSRANIDYNNLTKEIFNKLKLNERN